MIVRKVTVVAVSIRRWAFKLIHIYYVVPVLLLGTITICMLLDEYGSIIVWDKDLIILRDLWLDHLELTIIRILRLLDLELWIKLMCILLLLSLETSFKLPLISIRPLI